jgi:hypothetical protein
MKSTVRWPAACSVQVWRGRASAARVVAVPAAAAARPAGPESRLRSLRSHPYQIDTTWMPHPGRNSSMAGTSTPYQRRGGRGPGRDHGARQPRRSLHGCPAPRRAGRPRGKLITTGVNVLAGLASGRPGRCLDPGGLADAARLAVGEGADGGGDHVGGAVDVPGDRAGRVAHRRGHLGPAQPGQHGGDLLDLREEVTVPDVDERDRAAAVPGEERLLLRRRLLQVGVPERGAGVGGLAEPLDRDEGQVLAAVMSLGERQRGGAGVDVGGRGMDESEARQGAEPADRGGERPIARPRRTGSILRRCRALPVSRRR